MRAGELADKVVRSARARAAVVLTRARRQEDRASARGSGRDRLQARRQRAKADAKLQREYSSADVRIERERASRVRALARLFLAERQVTDERLLLERSRSDQLVAARDELLAKVSHDLRGFLGTIALRAEFLQCSISENLGKSGNGATGSMTEAVAGTKEVLALMGRLIGDLVDTASMESGAFQIVKDDGRLDRLVLESAEAFREAALERGVALTVATSRCPAVRFDHLRIVQVLSNLVGNALKYTPRGGRIAIRLEAVSGRCQVSVADTGPGIPEERLGSIFDRFTRGPRMNEGGLGLGLFIVRSIVQAHGGRTWVESAPGRGSTFYFTLPALRSRRPTGRRPKRAKRPASARLDAQPPLP